MAGTPEANDLAHHPLDTLSSWTSQAANEVWTRAKSMSTGEWIAAGTLVAAGVGGAGFTALRAAGIIGRGLSGTTEAAVGAAGAFSRDETLPALLRGAASDTNAALTNPLVIEDPTLSGIFTADRAVAGVDTNFRAPFDPFRKPLTIADPDTAVGAYQASRLPVYQQLSQQAFMGLPRYLESIGRQAKVGMIGDSTQIARIMDNKWMRDIVIRRDANVAVEQVSKVLPGRQFELVETRFINFGDRNARLYSDTDRGMVRTTISNGGRVTGSLLSETDALADMKPINRTYMYHSAEGAPLSGLFGRLYDV